MSYRHELYRVVTQSYQGVFTSPVPKLNSKGCDFVSGSGATAVFIFESAMPKCLNFSSVYSVGNSSQTGVEEVLESLGIKLMSRKSVPL